VTVSKFSLNEPDQKRVVSSKVDEVIRAVVELGGTYPDIVQALQQAKSKNVLASRFEVDALPKAGRRYYRDSNGDEQEADPAARDEEAGPGSEFVVGNPQPGLFAEPSEKTSSKFKTPADDAEENSDEEAEMGRSWGTIFDRMLGREKQ
jgi:hypothetical protein